MEKFDFEKLNVYQKALDFTDRICDLFEKMPFSIQKTIGDNLLRAAISIASNIAEGSGRRGKREKKHFFEIAQGSAYECVPSLAILHKRNKIKKEVYENLYNECCTISKMLTGLISRFV